MAEEDVDQQESSSSPQPKEPISVEDAAKLKASLNRQIQAHKRAREQAESELAELRERLQELESRTADSDLADMPEDQLKAETRRLRSRVRALEDELAWAHGQGLSYAAQALAADALLSDEQREQMDELVTRLSAARTESEMKVAAKEIKLELAKAELEAAKQEAKGQAGAKRGGAQIDEGLSSGARSALITELKRVQDAIFTGEGEREFRDKEAEYLRRLRAAR